MTQDPFKQVLLAMVSYRPEIDFRVIQSLDQCVPSLAAMGYHASRLLGVGNADLAGERNNLLAEFYNGPFSDMIFIDADVSCEPGSLERLLRHPVDLVFGAYPRRTEGEGFSGRTLPGDCICVDPMTGKPHPNGLIEMAGGPTGFMRITRDCVDKMIEGYPDRWYKEPRVTGGKAYNFFEFCIHDKERWTEDYNFCRLWRERGGKVWCDPHLTLHHHGDKTYSGKFYDHLKQLGRLKTVSAND